MSLPTASGYPQYSGNLINPIYSTEIIERFYCESIFPEISDTNYAGALKKCGDQVTFWRAPRAVIHDYAKNQKLEHDVIESEPVTLCVDRGTYFNLKMDMVDEKQICNASDLRQKYIKDATFRMTQKVDTEVLAYVPTRVDSRNQGQQAGAQTGTYQLGTLLNPRPVTKLDILDWMHDMHSVLDEACQPMEGRYLVLPHVAINMLLKSMLSNYNSIGGSTPEQIALNGRLPNVIAGFNIYRSSNIAFGMNGGNRVYSTIAGVKNATAFAGQIEYMREIEHPDYFGTLNQGVMVYGFEVMQPESVLTSQVVFQ